MSKNFSNLILCLVILCFSLINQNCTSEKNDLPTIKTTQGQSTNNDIEKKLPTHIDIENKIDSSSQSPTVLVLECANGYDYSTYNYDLDPIISNELNKFNSITVLPFPFKTLMNIPYQGVFDKKYCKPIIDKVDADYLIMSRFSIDYAYLDKNNNEWGYEVRILNTKTMKQVNSIHSSGLSSFSEVEADIKSKLDILVHDILKTK